MDVYAGIEANDKCFVFSLPQHVEEKFGGRVLLELELIANAGARIDYQSDKERKVVFTAEMTDRLEFVVFEDLKIFLIQIVQQLSFFIRDCELDVHKVHIYPDCLLIVCRCRSRSEERRVGK